MGLFNSARLEEAKFVERIFQLSSCCLTAGRRARCSGEEVAEEELMRLFEAARWAPSSFNAQQWRALYARRGTEHWPVFFGLLVEANKSWAKNRAALVVLISRKIFDSTKKPRITPS